MKAREANPDKLRRNIIHPRRFLFESGCHKMTNVKLAKTPGSKGEAETHSQLRCVESSSEGVFGRFKKVVEDSRIRVDGK
jgi:hypothetical protein